MRATRKRFSSFGLLVAVATVAAITGAIFGLREIMPVLSTGVIYLLGVLLVSIYWPLWLGLATALASVLAFNFFHLEPTGGLTVAGEGNWAALVVYLIVAVVASTLADAARSRAEEAERRRREADLAAELARVLLGGPSIEDSLRDVGARIAAAYDIDPVSVELGWVASGAGRRATPLLVGGARAATLLVPEHIPVPVEQALRERVVPALEALVGARRRREQLEAQAVEASALRRSDVAKTSLLRAVSHDLRSPLMAISTAGGGLSSPTLSEQDRRELVAIVETEAARLSRLIDNLLDLSRLRAGAAEPRSDWCSLDEVVRAALAGTPQPAKGFELAVEAKLPPIRVDATQLERAFANVLENASRFAGDRAVVVSVHAAGPRLIARVVDRGPGIPADELARVFEPFHGSREQPGGGSGLGLAIARGFVEANGGRLRAESAPGQGTAFVFDIPVARDAAAPTGYAEASAR